MPVSMNQAIAVALFALFAGSACAQVAPLDLQLPPASVASSADATTATDPPGKYYGDVDGSADDATKTKVWGSVSMGVGHAEGFGTGESVGADLNISRQFDDGRRMDLHIDVERNSGFPWRSPYNYYGSRYQGH